MLRLGRLRAMPLRASSCAAKRQLQLLQLPLVFWTWLRKWRRVWNSLWTCISKTLWIRMPSCLGWRASANVWRHLGRRCWAITISCSVCLTLLRGKPHRWRLQLELHPCFAAMASAGYTSTSACQTASFVLDLWFYFCFCLCFHTHFRHLHWWCHCWRFMPFCHREAYLQWPCRWAHNSMHLRHVEEPLGARVNKPGILHAMWGDVCLQEKNIYLQKGHALRVVFTCRRCRRKWSWSSSRVFANHYLVNQKLVVYGHHIKWCSSCRLVHSFTCAGKLPVQYSKFSRFAGLGVLGTSYLSHGNFWSKFSEFLHVECLHCTQCIGRVR